VRADRVEAVIAAVLTCRTLKQAAAQVGLSDRHLRRLLRLPAVLQRLTEAAREKSQGVIDEAFLNDIAFLRAESQALSALKKDCKHKNPRIHWRAAKFIPEHDLDRKELAIRRKILRLKAGLPVNEQKS
jgi:hypothetical protein